MSSEFDWHPDYRSGSVFKVETRNLGWWIVLAILFSVIVHVLLYLLLSGIYREPSGPQTSDIVFQMSREQQTIDRDKLEEILADPEIPAPEELPDLQPEKLSDLEMIDQSLDEFDLMEQIRDEVVRMAPIESPRIFSDGAPTAPSQALDVANRSMDFSASELLSEELSNMKNELINSSAQVSGNQAVLELNTAEELSEGVDTDEFFREAAAKAFGEGATEKIAGYSGLDELIGRTGALPPGEEKIALPTDILFEYNEFELKEAAKLSMMKLAFLVQTNPNARFVIEGHTDSFGGDNFNLELSRKRAQAVRDWLVERLRISDENIEIVGKGKAEPIVSIEGTAEEQALNRRVEIVVKTPEGETGIE